MWNIGQARSRLDRCHRADLLDGRCAAITERSPQSALIDVVYARADESATAANASQHCVGLPFNLANEICFARHTALAPFRNICSLIQLINLQYLHKKKISTKNRYQISLISIFDWLEFNESPESLLNVRRMNVTRCVTVSRSKSNENMSFVLFFSPFEMLLFSFSPLSAYHFRNTPCLLDPRTSDQSKQQSTIWVYRGASHFTDTFTHSPAHYQLLFGSYVWRAPAEKPVFSIHSYRFYLYYWTRSIRCGMIAQQ